MKKLIITTLLAILFMPTMAQREIKEVQVEVQKEKKEKGYAEIKFEKTNV